MMHSWRTPHDSVRGGVASVAGRGPAERASCPPPSKVAWRSAVKRPPFGISGIKCEATVIEAETHASIKVRVRSAQSI